MLTLCVSISLSATVTLVCLYSPKVYILLFHPDKNVRKLTMNSSAAYRRSGGRAPPPVVVVRTASTGCGAASTVSARAEAAKKHGEGQPVVVALIGTTSSSLDEGYAGGSGLPQMSGGHKNKQQSGDDHIESSDGLCFKNSASCGDCSHEAKVLLTISAQGLYMFCFCIEFSREQHVRSHLIQFYLIQGTTSCALW